MPGRDSIQRLLALLYQRRRSSSLKRLQGCLTQSKYWRISLASPGFWLRERRLILHIPQPGRLVCLPRDIVSLLFTDSPKAPVPFPVQDPSVNQTSPLTTGGVPGLLVHSLVHIVTLYLGSSLKAGFIMSTPIAWMGSDFRSWVNMWLCPRWGWR